MAGKAKEMVIDSNAIVEATDRNTKHRVEYK
jgi:hypothetical protein